MPGVPRHVPGWSFLRGLPLLWRLLCTVPRLFSAGMPLPCSRLVGCLILLRLVWSALPLPACHALVRAFFLLSFAFFRLTFASQISFHLSLRPRRASTFFRKESRQRFAKGLRPFEPHSCALRSIFSSSSLLAGLRGLSGRKPRLAGKRLKSPGAELSFSSVSVQRGDACALSLITPFFSLLAGLSGPSGRKPPAGMGNARKAKEQSSAFRAFLCVGDAPGLSPCHKGQ